MCINYFYQRCTWPITFFLAPANINVVMKKMMNSFCNEAFKFKILMGVTFKHLIGPVLFFVFFMSFINSSLASSVEWRTQLRVSFPPGYRNTLIMKMVLKEEGLNRAELKTASFHHLHRRLSLLMAMTRDLLLMVVTHLSLAPVTQVNKTRWCFI